MSTYNVGFVGVGEDPEEADMSGFAMAYHHAEAYRSLENCEMVACADVVPENAAAFADRFGISDEHTYDSHGEMLADVDLDLLSVCVPPAIHADIVVDCIREGDLAGVHCEKPMDLTWGGARQMAETAWRHDVQLTFNHQRRFHPAWVGARETIESGAIGDLERVEMAPPTLYDWGTHAIDFAGQVVGDRPAEWAIGQVDYRDEQLWFGAHNENQAFGQWEYDNGVRAVISTGAGAALVEEFFTFVGTEGVLHLDNRDSRLRWRRHGDEEWERRTFDTDEWTDPITTAIADVVECLETGEEPTLGARNALNATEIIFGIWESARRRGRVEFPLEITDNPLHEMVESGALDPEPAEE